MFSRFPFFRFAFLNHRILIPSALGSLATYTAFKHFFFNGSEKKALMIIDCQTASPSDLIQKLQHEMRHRPSKSFPNPTVVFVIGGPGAGKGTQCSRLVQDFPRVVHLSAGELLRNEQARPNSALGSLIISCINNGTIVPMHVTIQLLENAMREHPDAEAFLVDGFPRAIDQGEEFERLVCQSSAVIYYECPESVMMDRLLRRGKISGRSDDNQQTILKRFQTFIYSSLPVVQHYQHKLYKIDCIGAEEEVYQRTQKAFINILANKHYNNQAKEDLPSF